MNLKSLLLLVAIAATGCYAESSSTGTSTPDAEKTVEVSGPPSAVMQVSGMTCGGCESMVVKKLEALDEVSAAKADAESGRVEVHFVSGKDCSEDTLTKAVADAGEQYTVDSIQ